MTSVSGHRVVDTLTPQIAKFSKLKNNDLSRHAWAYLDDYADSCKNNENRWSVQALQAARHQVI